MDQIYNVLVIGAGPAGLSVAAECAYHNLDNVLLLEKGKSHNQTVVQYYPENKRVDAAYKGNEAICAGVLCFKETTKPLFMNVMDKLIALYKLSIDFGCAVDSIRKDKEGIFHVSGSTGKEYLTKNVVITIGRMGRPNHPDYYKDLPAAVKANLFFELKKLKAEKKKLLVVGGGNTATEYALSLTDRFSVTLSYRKKDFTRLNEMNLKLLIEDEAKGAIRILRGSDIQTITNANDKALVNFDGAEDETFDQVLFGIGGSNPAAFLESAGLKINEKGNPILDDWLETNVEGVYVAGELCVPPGKGSIIASFNSGKHVVEGIMNKQERKRKAEVVTVL